MDEEVTVAHPPPRVIVIDGEDGGDGEDEEQVEDEESELCTKPSPTHYVCGSP